MRWALASLVAASLLTGLLAPAATADMGLPEIQQRLLKSNMLRATFDQEKNLRALSRPLVSYGKLLFLADKGVLWQVMEPYPAIVLMKPDAIIEWNGEGEMRRADTASNPVFRALSEIILSILSGDTQLIGQYFEFSPAEADVGWQLVLRPKSEELAAAVSSVQIFGDRFVEKVQINETKGDTTKLQFSEFSVGPFELNEIEKSHFSP